MEPFSLLKERFLTIIISLINLRFNKYVLSAIICFPILFVIETFSIIKAKKVCMMNESYNKYVSVIRKIFSKKKFYNYLSNKL